MLFVYTGNVLIPASLSMVGAIAGWLKKSPIYGTDRKNWIMVPKKSPKSPNIPTDSTINPINDHFIKINNMPTQKHTVPLILVGREKNAMVRCGPIIKMSPITKRIFPIAKSAASKNAIMPTKKSPRPPAVNPTPNSALVVRQTTRSKSMHTLSIRKPDH